MPGQEAKIPFMGGTLIFQDPFDFDTEDGQKKHVDARVLLRGDTKFEIAIPLSGYAALVASAKVEAVKEWLARNKPTA